MAGEGTFPKSPGDILYASEVNAFNTDIAGNVTAIGLNTTHRGSNGTDHSLIASKTSYYSINPTDFTFGNPSFDVALYFGAHFKCTADNRTFYAPVHLPHGAVVTACVIYGNAGATSQAWGLTRSPKDSGGVTFMAAANVDTEDTSISSATIDNLNYNYFTKITDLDTNDEIYGGTITYTTNYI